MTKTKVIGLNAYLKQLKKGMMSNLVEEQSLRFVEYAQNKINAIADDIVNRGYSMDRTGNLLDSLCWGVSYRGKLKGSGFYREQKATENSYLHELFPPDWHEMFPVYGHGLAQMFLKDYGSRKYDGWQVFFAILAPYWGYWESGHNNVLTKKKERFAVMAEFYDQAKRDLKPTQVRFIHSAPSYTKEKLERMRKHMAKSTYHEKRHYSKWPSIKK